MPASGSGVADSTKAVLVNRRSLRAGFAIGVATSVAVALAPLGRLSTVQKVPVTVPSPDVKETGFSGSGMGSPKTTPAAAAGPRLVTVIVNERFSPGAASQGIARSTSPGEWVMNPRP